MNIILGCHLSVSDGYKSMAQTALSIGANTFQFFTRNPRGGAIRVPSDKEISEFNAFLKNNGFGRIIAHAPYTLNPCAKDDSILDYTRQTMADDILLLDKIPSAMYNFHPGCHVSQGEEAGIEKTADTLKIILEMTATTPVLIETMAGKGTEIGKTFEQIQAIIKKAGENGRIGVCLDTCHVHDGGYSIAENPEKVLKEFDSVIGLGRLKAIHLNDSKNPIGAHKDRHEKIGDGFLTEEGIERIISNGVINALPICLETPNDLEGYAREIRILREYMLNK